MSRKLLLVVSVLVVRSILGNLTLSHHSYFRVPELTFNPEDGTIHVTARDIPWFPVLRTLMLQRSPARNHEPNLVKARDLERDLVLALARNVDVDLAPDSTQSLSSDLTRDLDWDLARARDQTLALTLDLAEVSSVARDLVLDLSRSLDLARDLTKLRSEEQGVASDLESIRERAKDWSLDQNLAEAKDLAVAGELVGDVALAQAQLRSLDLASAQALELANHLGMDWFPELDMCWDLDERWELLLLLDDWIRGVQGTSGLSGMHRGTLAVARDVMLASLCFLARNLIVEQPEIVQYLSGIVRLLRSAPRTDTPWYGFVVSQYIEAGQVLQGDKQLLAQLGLPSNIHGSPEYQAVLINMSTLLHLLNIHPMWGLSEDVVHNNPDPDVGYIVSTSYILHRIVTGEATQEEQQEFWQLLEALSANALGTEWLELTGLSLLQPST